MIDQTVSICPEQPPQFPFSRRQERIDSRYTAKANDTLLCDHIFNLHFLLFTILFCILHQTDEVDQYRWRPPISTWMAGLAASSRAACIESQTRRPYPRLHPPPSIAPLCGGEPTCEQVYGNSQCGWRRLKGAGRAGLTGGAAAVATAVAHLSLGAGRAGRGTPMERRRGERCG